MLYSLFWIVAPHHRTQIFPPLVGMLGMGHDRKYSLLWEFGQFLAVWDNFSKLKVYLKRKQEIISICNFVVCYHQFLKYTACFQRKIMLQNKVECKHLFHVSNISEADKLYLLGKHMKNA